MPVLSHPYKARIVVLLRSKYKFAIAILVGWRTTPTSDIFNMMLFAAPMLVLYS